MKTQECDASGRWLQAATIVGGALCLAAGSIELVRVLVAPSEKDVYNLPVLGVIDIVSAAALAIGAGVFLIAAGVWWLQRGPRSTRRSLRLPSRRAMGITVGVALLLLAGIGWIAVGGLSKRLVVSVQGSGSGRLVVTLGDDEAVACEDVYCAYEAGSGDMAVLLAEPAQGSFFAGYSERCHDQPTCSLSMSYNQDVTVYFDLDLELTEAPQIVAVSASSTLAPEHLYAARHVVEHGNDKSWVEGADEDGVGEWVRLDLAEPTVVESMEIVNGFGVQKSWRKNNRIEVLELRSDNGALFTADLKDELATQTIDFPKNFQFNELTLTIRSVYRGSKYRDTAIAEVRFPGQSVRLPDTTQTVREKQRLRNILSGRWCHEGEAWELRLHHDESCVSIDGGEGSEPSTRETCGWEVTAAGGLLISLDDEDRDLELYYYDETDVLMLGVADDPKTHRGFAANRCP